MTCLDRPHPLAALRQQGLPGFGDMQHLDTAMFGMSGAGHHAGLQQIGDDHAQSLRRQLRQPRQIGVRRPRIGPQHGQHQELRQRQPQIGKPPLHPQPMRRRRLTQQIAKIALLAPLALAGLGDGFRHRPLAHNIRALICCQNSDTIPFPPRHP